MAIWQQSEYLEPANEQLIYLTAGLLLICANNFYYGATQVQMVILRQLLLKCIVPKIRVNKSIIESYLISWWSDKLNFIYLSVYRVLQQLVIIL